MSLGSAYVAIRADLKPLETGLRSGYRSVSTTLGKMGGVVKGLGRTLMSLKSLAIVAFAGWGIKKITDSLIDAASTAEGYRTRLNILLGSVEEGNKLFAAMADYAGKVPFTYQEIMGAATSLSGVMKGGVDEISKWMPVIGDLAAASGLTIEEVTGQVIRMYSAGAASADMFRERGILAMLGFQAGVSYSAEETRKMLLESWEKTDSQFRGATDALAGTWKGLMSMFSDQWFAFRTMVADAGLWEYMKEGAENLLFAIRDLKESGKLGEWAEYISDKFSDVVLNVGLLIEKLFHLYESGVIEKWGVIAMEHINATIKGVKSIINFVTEMIQVFYNAWDFWDRTFSTTGNLNTGNTAGLAPRRTFSPSTVQPSGSSETINNNATTNITVAPKYMVGGAQELKRELEEIDTRWN